MKLLAAGGLVLVLPWILGMSPLPPGVRSLMPAAVLVPVAVLLLLAGGFLLWLPRKKAEPPPPALFQASSSLSRTRSRPAPLRRSNDPAPPSEGAYRRPTCVKCGLEMVQRQPRQHERPYWGCVAYPRCQTRMAMPRN